MKRKVTALVPMKAHSERVKNKNLRDFNGKPLLWYILNTLSECQYVSCICVDTDGDLIRETVHKYFDNVMVVDRPEPLCGDFVSMNRIIEHDISILEDEYFIQTHTTNPLLKPSTIDGAIEYFFEHAENDSVFSANRIQTRLYDSAGRPLNHDPKELIRTQDLPPVYEENSNFYIFSKSSFVKTNARIGDTPYIYEMNPLESVDIDNDSDFILAEELQRLQIIDR